MTARASIRAAWVLAAVTLATSSAPGGPKGRGSKAPPVEQDIRRFTFNWQKDLEPAWYDETPGVLKTALAGDLAEVEEIVFAARGCGRDWHWYANFGYNIRREKQFYHGGIGGALCAVNPRTGKLRILLRDYEGDIRDPAVSYDGKTVLFSYRKGGERQFHLYTVPADASIGSDGSPPEGLTPLTDGAFDDIEPCWLPDGGIMFCSSRCMRWVPCWYSQVAIMYRCEADGSDLRPVSFGVENENTPWPMPDGRVLYTRWEYVDRSQTGYHGLWTIDPDGTGTALLFDNLGTSNLYIDAKSIPGTREIVSVITPGHGRNEHRGRLGIIRPAAGPDSERAARFLDRGYPARTAEKRKGHVGEEAWRDPYPVSADCFLAATRRCLAVMNAGGDYEVFFELPGGWHDKWWAHEPRPLRARRREPIIPHTPDSGDGMATVAVMDVTEGRNMEGIDPGDIRRLLVMEELPRPASVCAYADALSSGPNYVLHRILGTAEVESDGSAHFRIPAGRPVFFYALDANGLAAKVMSSYISAMPGEAVSCVGCHERRVHTPMRRHYVRVPAALKRAPDALAPLSGVPEIMDYVRDIQPIWDAHCVRCHNYRKQAGKLLLVDDMTPAFSVSYHQLKRRRPGGVKLAHCNPGSNPGPYKTASGGSRLLEVLLGGHQDVKLSPVELERIKRWADSGTVFAGTYAALGSVSRDNRIKLTDTHKPLLDVMKRRCDRCHQSKWTRGHWLDGENRRVAGRYNVTDPAKSLLLLAPLAKDAGGLGWCVPEKHDGDKAPPFAERDSEDFKTLRAFVDEIVTAFGRPRWFQDGFRPRDFYIREMKRFGALPAAFDADRDTLRPYAADRRYFRTIYRQGPGPKPGSEDE